MNIFPEILFDRLSSLVCKGFVCFQMCEPDNVWEGIRERMMIKKWQRDGGEKPGSRGGSERAFTFFSFPTAEPKYHGNEVGTPAMITPLLLKGKFREARDQSVVKGLDTNVTSFSGFITVNNTFEVFALSLYSIIFNANIEFQVLNIPKI